LQFSPSILGLTISGSQNWVDPLVGGRIEAALSSKVEVNILGDVGGWGTGSQLDYQVVGILGYRIKPKWMLQAGYRYLDVNYRSGFSILDTDTAGALFGVSIALK
jgi:opacity protein-like surface antigen